MIGECLRGAGTGRGRLGKRPRPDVGLGRVGEVHREWDVARPGAEGVHTDAVRLGEGHRASRHRHGPVAAGRIADRRGVDAMLHGEEDRVPGRAREIGPLQRDRVQPPEAVREDHRERNAQRQVRLEEVEPDEHRLALWLLEEVDQGPADRLEECPPRGERPHAECRLDADLGEVDEAHDGMRAVPVEDRRLLELAERLDRDVAREGVDKHEPPRADLRRGGAVEDDDIGAGHPTGVLSRGLRLQDDLWIGPERLLEEQVAGAHEEHAELLRGGEDGDRRIVDREVVGDPGLHSEPPATWVRERDDDVPLDPGGQRNGLLAEGAVVEGQREREPDGVVAEVGQGDERLIVVRVVGALPDREPRDRDVPGAAADAHPPDPGIGELLRQRRVECTVRQDVYADPRVPSGHERKGRSDRPVQPVREIARLEGPYAGPGAAVIPRERHADGGVRAGFDHHDLRPGARFVDQGGRARLGGPEAAWHNIARLHGRGDVHHEHQAVGALAREQDRRPSQREDEQE